MAPAYSRPIPCDEPPQGDGNTAAVASRSEQTKQPRPDQLIDLAKAEKELRASLALIPLFLFREHRGGVIAEYINILVRQVKNATKTQQPIHQTVMGKLDLRRQTPFPTRTEFQLRGRELVCDGDGEPLLKLDFAVPDVSGAALAQLIAIRRSQWEKDIVAAQGQKDHRPSDTARPHDGVQAISASNDADTVDAGNGEPRPSSMLVKLKMGRKPNKPERSLGAILATASADMCSHFDQGLQSFRDRLEEHCQARDRQHAAEIAKHTDRIEELSQQVRALEQQIEALTEDKAERKRKATEELESKAKRFIQELLKDSD